MILAFDVGNTFTKVALCDPPRILSRASHPTDELTSLELAKSMIHAVLEAAPTRGARSLRPVLCSVAPHVEETITAAVRDLLPRGAPILRVRPDLRLGLHVGVRRPERVGADRLAAAVGAVAIAGAPVIALCCGTAITTTVVDPSGVLIGGAIAPGPAIAARALSENTALLPMVDAAEHWEREMPPAIGMDTEEAILSGVLHGAAGTVAALVRETRKQLGIRAPVVVGGGYARLAARWVPAPRRVEPDLILKGIYRIAELNPPNA